MVSSTCYKTYLQPWKVVSVHALYNIWSKGVRLLRPGLDTESKCPQCGAAFLENKCISRHAHECRRRRQAENLPLDTNTYHRLPDEDNAERAHATPARARALDAQAPAAQAKFRGHLARNPHHEVPDQVTAASCHNPDTGARCVHCRKCDECAGKKRWGQCRLPKMQAMHQSIATSSRLVWPITISSLGSNQGGLRHPPHSTHGVGVDASYGSNEQWKSSEKSTRRQRQQQTPP